jgi:hypothetical protein
VNLFVKKADFNPSAQHKFDAAKPARCVKFEPNLRYFL